jgi:hypothetical protein
MGSLPPEALLIIIVLVFAGATGLGVWLYFYASGKTKPKRKANPSTAATQEVDELSPDDGKELLRVSRTKAGTLAVFVQGQHYHHLRGITDPKVEHEVISAIDAIRAFGEGVLPASQPASPQASPQPLAPAGAPVDRAAPVRAPRRPFTPSPPPAKSAPARSASLLQPGHFLDPLTFVNDIDALTKQKLQQHPDLASRFVQLEAGPDGGIRIHVDHQVFEAVGDITDPQIRGLIQEAIREWERG